MASKLQLQHWLSDSWQRSVGAGLSEFQPPEELRLNSSAIRQKHEQHGQLIDLVQSHALPLFNQLMAHTSSRLILSDREGYVLSHWGVDKYSDRLANVALDIGVNWQEEHKGTNAIGTALTARQAVSVVGDQHFIRQHRFMSCTACPIFSPSGEMIAAIDITSEQQRHTQQTLLLVSSLAQQVETALLCHLPDSHYRINLASQSSLINSGWQGILVADTDGKILGCNPMAKQLLGSAKVGDAIDQHLGRDWNHNERIQQHENLHLQTQPLKPARIGVVQSRARSNRPVSQLGVKFREPKLERAWQHANKVLSKNIPLLITGETGVGKDQFVKQLHAQSQRREQPIVAVNCAALPDNLVESELFGYHSGAFTGANRAGYIGKIRQADGGFLFLDEIGEMSLGAQSRLLRVLQEREVIPVGSNNVYKVDIQVIGATHTDLKQRVADGLFRQDLYYRLNGLQIRLPPLRHRSDIERIIQKLHNKHKAREQALCGRLLNQLCHYQWPGNLRELDNFMQVASIMAEGESELNWSALPDELQMQLMDGKAIPPTESEPMELSDTVDANVVAAYRRFEGNVSQCAKHLGVSRNTLYRKLKRLGLKS
ncbi:sigma-54-dependent Fis family transcriptional regulator [Shewanella canadensis]|uniref:Sigma-54-dependent Fis family transcriptional regulator n=1 Tax=Shewanella canadensis TaxID=271096 RepID=A0A3S0ILU8_9GAMM|nr:sigma-54-dependent Fis family transcriptional regulator [Shewanella canadensis]RTR38099.1 sigma-54-dependent Fis family transcriptional regulator [Shewanella canadensis]